MRTGFKIDMREAQRLADAGLNAPAIAERMGVTRQAIYLARHRGDLTIQIEPRARCDQETVTLERGTPGRRSQIEPDELRKMISDGKTTRQIAAHFRVQGPAIVRACHRHGLNLPPSPKDRGASDSQKTSRERPPAPKATPKVPLTTRRLQTLAATGGRHRDLSAWATEWATTMAQARIEWSRLGLPLVKKEDW